MSNNRTNKQKHLASQSAGTKFVRAMRHFVEVHMIYVGDTMQIKENSP